MRIYHGQSMKGTFHEGDILTIVKPSAQNMRAGDIIVFIRYGQCNVREEIVHRVMRRLSSGLITQGDAVAHEDAGMVTEQNLVGRVFYKERNGRIRRVYGGWIGLCRGRWLHFYWGVRRRAVRGMQKPYAVLKTSGIISRLWKPEIFRVRVNSQEGPCIQHVWKDRIVARFWPEQGRFECKKPWDLVIHEVDG